MKRFYIFIAIICSFTAAFTRVSRVRRFGIADGGGVKRLAGPHVGVPEDPEDADDTESEVPMCVPSSVVVGRLPSDAAFDLVLRLKSFLNSSWSKVRVDWRRCSVVSARCIEGIF